jgi:ABC-type polysaccharide/polyol phosphate export permease
MVFLVLFGYFWSFLVIFGNFWLFLVVFGCFWCVDALRMLSRAHYMIIIGHRMVFFRHRMSSDGQNAEILIGIPDYY